jgi:hypothetical protein
MLGRAGRAKVCPATLCWPDVDKAEGAEAYGGPKSWGNPAALHLSHW